MENSIIKRPYALITGASSGIGIYYTKEMLKRAYNVIVVSNQDEELKKVTEELNKNHNPIKLDIISIYKDLAKPQAAQELFDYCSSNSIDIEVLINNAGIFFFNDIAYCKESKIDTIIILHVLTPSKLCKLFAEQMIKREKGYILNMSSISCHTPFSGIALYSATKSYIRNFSKALQLELEEHNIKVAVVCPGAVATNLYKLPKRLQNLGVNLGIIYLPDKFAAKAIKLLFKGKREIIPGYLNRLFRPIYNIIPHSLKLYARKKTKVLMKNF